MQGVEKSVSNQKVASSIPCRSVFEQDTEPLIAPGVCVCACVLNDWDGDMKTLKRYATQTFNVFLTLLPCRS